MKEDRILLINPPYPFFWETEAVDHLGLGYISSYTKSQGYKNVEIFNFSRSPFSDIFPKLNEFRPKYVGISVPYTQAYPNAQKVAKMVKEFDPHITVAMGGAHPSAFPGDVIEDENVDYVVRGEGEIAFQHVLGGELGPIIDSDHIKDLDSLPFPDRPVFNKNHIGVVTSRGCLWNCTFCAVHIIWGYGWRARSPENVIKEVKSLQVPFISFDDDNLVQDKNRAEQIFLLLKKECKVQWNTPNGIFMDTLDYNLLKLMKESGCYGLVLPIESGDNFIRNKVMGKSVKREKIIEVVESCKDLGILTLGCFVIGMPKENMETMNRSLEFSKELMIDAINVSIATPYPGTKLYKQCLEKGYLTTKDYSIFSALGESVINTPYLTAKEVTKFRTYFIDEFHKYHNAHSSISTELKQKMVRRPIEANI